MVASLVAYPLAFPGLLRAVAVCALLRLAAATNRTVGSKDPRIVYTGPWFDQDNGGHQVCGQLGCSASFTFKGSAVYFVSAHNWNAGSAAVSVDGGPSTTVDESANQTKNSTVIPIVPLFGATGLDGSNNHTMLVEYAGPGVLLGPYLEVYGFIYDDSPGASASSTTSSPTSSGTALADVTSSASTSKSSDPGKSALIGGVVGGVVGGALLTALVVLLVVCLRRRRRVKARQATEAEDRRPKPYTARSVARSATDDKSPPSSPRSLPTPSFSELASVPRHGGSSTVGDLEILQRSGTPVSMTRSVVGPGSITGQGTGSIIGSGSGVIIGQGTGGSIVGHGTGNIVGQGAGNPTSPLARSALRSPVDSSRSPTSTLARGASEAGASETRTAVSTVPPLPPMSEKVRAAIHHPEASGYDGRAPPPPPLPSMSDKVRVAIRGRELPPDPEPSAPFVPQHAHNASDGAASARVLPAPPSEPRTAAMLAPTPAGEVRESVMTPMTEEAPPMYSERPT